MSEIAKQQRSFYDISDDLAAYHESLAQLDVAGELAPVNLTDPTWLAERAEILVRIEAIGAELIRKTEALVGVIQRQNSEVDLLKEEEKRIYARRKSVEAAQVWLKAYVIRVMQGNGQMLIRTPTATLRIQRNGGVDPLEVEACNLEDDFLDVCITMPVSTWLAVVRAVADNSEWGQVRQGDPMPNTSRIREALNDPCGMCEGRAVLPDGDNALPCSLCQGTGKRRIAGAQLLPRGVHLRTS